MAYRVERAFSYKIRVNSSTNRIVTFGGMGDRFGIDISFGNPNHSEYYTAEHKDEKGLRLVTFQMNEKFWSAIKYLKKIGKEHGHAAGKRWLEGKKSLRKV
ncbi:hypothetical protein [Xanthomonas phaseoli]|nr:hypothetical protein [Xanthomonas phaseoli]MBO9798389.1 hypothetical protein [Xanthomonas phaseoli pv. dieffenbachiae]MBO9802423.1 hypothetical protein [Xanthomonas phaseoli pv. dieffenbachiae]MBO9806454.1 hypothetical protein [Xanthomonas phaseoli pv. dieffenbachiae]MBO9810496.1 hypothetical protein [Xanthomonas phaseoli pv. dieffenbachiae]MBO9814517.1 hypothetical protein [Xanthomonas phaseoli pv. dieffenbachiae]